MNSSSLITADPEDKKIMESLREKKKQTRIEFGKNGEFKVNYLLQIKNTNKSNNNDEKLIKNIID
jgi:hypothetical protein